MTNKNLIFTLIVILAVAFVIHQKRKTKYLQTPNTIIRSLPPVENKIEVKTSDQEFPNPIQGAESSSHILIDKSADIAPNTESIEQKTATKPETQTQTIISTPPFNPKDIPSLDQFKHDHPDTKIITQKLDPKQMIPAPKVTIEQFKKDHPNAQVKFEKLESGAMIPSK